MERLKDDSQVASVVMRGPRVNRESPVGKASEPLVTEDADRQAQAGEEDQSPAGDDSA